MPKSLLLLSLAACCSAAMAAPASRASRPALTAARPAPGTGRPASLRVAAGAALGNLLQGFNTGVIAGALLFIVPEFGCSPQVTGLIASSTTLGAVAGTLSCGKLCNTAGRQRTLLLSSLLFLAGGLLMGWSPTVAVLIAGRLVSGAGAGLVSAAVPTYIAECAEPTWRGALSTLPQLCVSSGILLSYLVALASLVFGGSWRLMLAVSLLPAALQAAAVLSLPESPRWLLSQRDGDARALRALTALRGRDDVQEELRELKAGLEKERARAAAAGASAATAGSFGGFGALLAPGMRRVLLLTCLLQAAQQLCGVNAIVYFTPSILKEAGAHKLFLGWGVSKDVAAMLATVLAYLPKIPSVLLATYLIDRRGRRWMLTRCVPPLAVCLAVLAASVGGAPAFGAGAATAAITLFGIFFGMSLGPLPNILAAELFPTAVRSQGVAASTTVQWVSNALVAMAFPVVSARFGMPRVIGGFAAVCVLAWLVVLRFVPETKGVALEDVGGIGAAKKQA